MCAFALYFLGASCAPHVREDTSSQLRGTFRVRVDTVFFSIVGSEDVQILSSMRSGAASRGLVGVARTNTIFRWDAIYGRRNGRCLVRQIDVSVSGKLILPHWENSDGADTVVASRWRHRLSSIYRHEGQHLSNAVATADTALRRVIDMSAGSCSRLRLRVRSTMNTALDTIRSRDAKLDSKR
jgi:predicted secreted Zn-dependent protease